MLPVVLPLRGPQAMTDRAQADPEPLTAEQMASIWGHAEMALADPDYPFAIGPQVALRLRATLDAVTRERDAAQGLVAKYEADLRAECDAHRRAEAAERERDAAQAAAAVNADTAERALAAVGTLRLALRTSHCPRPFPGDPTVGACVDAGRCGCDNQAALGGGRATT